MLTAKQEETIKNMSLNKILLLIKIRKTGDINFATCSEDDYHVGQRLKNHGFLKKSSVKKDHFYIPSNLQNEVDDMTQYVKKIAKDIL